MGIVRIPELRGRDFRNICALDRQTDRSLNASDVSRVVMETHKERKPVLFCSSGRFYVPFNNDWQRVTGAECPRIAVPVSVQSSGKVTPMTRRPHDRDESVGRV